MAETVEITQQIADAILRISEAYDRMQKSGLTEKALVMLISDASGVGKRDVQFVLNGIHNLRLNLTRHQPKTKQ